MIVPLTGRIIPLLVGGGSIDDTIVSGGLLEDCADGDRVSEMLRSVACHILCY